MTMKTNTTKTRKNTTSKRYPTATPVQTAPAITPEEADQLRKDRACSEICSNTRIRKHPFAKFYTYADGRTATEADWIIQCKQDYTDWEEARKRGEVWALDVPGESPDQVFRYYGGRVYKFSNGRPATEADWMAQWERGREERMAIREAEETKRLKAEMEAFERKYPNGYVPMNCYQHMIQDGFDRNGFNSKGEEHRCPGTCKYVGHSDIAGDLERDLRGGSREPEYREERTQNDWGRSRAVVYSVNPDGSSCNGRVYR